MFVELMTCLMFVLQGLYSVCGAHYLFILQGCIVFVELVPHRMFLAPAVNVGEMEGAINSTSVFFCLFFCL